MIDAQKFVGMSKKEAQDFAERANLIFRIVSIGDETYLGEPPDVREDRLCVKLDSSRRVEDARIC